MTKRKALTDIQCKTAKAKGKPTKLFDGMGLYLDIRATGSATWRVKYTGLDKKEKTFTIGEYGVISLGQARDALMEVKKQLAQGVDPVVARRKVEEAAKHNRENTFGNLAREWLGIQAPSWSAQTLKDRTARIEKDLLPELESRPINEITISEMRSVLNKVVERGALHLANRTRCLASRIFQLAIITDRCEKDPAAPLIKALPSKPTEHHRALDKRRLGDFISAVMANKARCYESTILAVWLSLLTFQRPGEIRQARWDELDLEKGIWYLGKMRMKQRKDHLVPLSRQAIAILKKQKRHSASLTSPYVFPNQRNPFKAMSENTVNQAIKSLGFGDETVAHGFRALARTAAREDLGWNSEVLERAIGHKPKGALGETYDRAELMEDRIKMFQDWGNHISTMAKKEIF